MELQEEDNYSEEEKIYDYEKKQTVVRSVWCKQRTRGFWDAARQGIFDSHWWRENLRMNKETFEMLCHELDIYLKKEVTRLRLPVSVDERVAVTIWRLATNVEYRTIASLFGLGISTVGKIVIETCQVIVEVLLPKLVKFPSAGSLKEVVSGFENLWGFPQTVGAIDGSHIPIIKPLESASIEKISTL